MKFKIEIDINDIMEGLFEDYHPDCDNFPEIDLKEEVMHEITRSTKNQVLEKYKGETESKIVERVKVLVDDKITKQIKKDVEDFVKNGKLKKYSTDEPKSVKEWINEKFTQESDSYSQTLRKVVASKAQEAVEELKSRYDLLFASQVITKLNDADMLKEGVFQALMASSNKG